MADELTQYYKDYYTKYGNNSYTMEAVKNVSRIKIMREYLEGNVKPGSKILDVGCGDGYLSTLMPQYDWHGIDINVERAKCPAKAHDLMTVPYPFDTGEFDAVVCSEVLEHVWDLRVVHKELHRLVKPGGIYLMSTPNFDWLFYQLTNYRGLLFDPTQSHLFEHIRQYNLQIHAKHLEEAGFGIMSYCGADAHYNPMFSGLRHHMTQWVNKTFGEKHGFSITEFDVDVVLGKSFPTTSHTIIVLSRKLA